MSEKTTCEVTLNEDQVQWLGEMAEAYALPDLSKALRVLLDYAQFDGNREEIFEIIRCRRC